MRKVYEAWQHKKTNKSGPRPRTEFGLRLTKIIDKYQSQIKPEISRQMIREVNKLYSDIYTIKKKNPLNQVDSNIVERWTIYIVKENEKGSRYPIKNNGYHNK